MAITVTDNRTLIDDGDAVTNWSSPVGGQSVTAFTLEPSPKEDSAHIGIQVSNTEAELLYTDATSRNLSSGVLVYIWILAQGIMESEAAYGISAVLGDGTDTNAYQVAGADKAVFRHSSGSSVGHQCILVDSGSLPTGKALRGTFGSLTDTAITEFGCNFVTTVKSVGGVENCFVDKVLFGNGGLTITGTDTASGFLDDLAVLDAAATSGQSYGGCRNLGGGIFGVQIQLLLGDTGSGTDTMSIVDQTLKFEDFSGVDVDKFGITIQGGSGTQTFAFTNSVLFCPVGTGAFLTATDTAVESFDMTGCLIRNFDQSIAFSADATNGPNHDISVNNFIGCAQINPGKTAFSDNTIDSTTEANGGMIIDSGVSMTNIDTLTFKSDGTGHAIYITATGTYSLTDFEFEGYSAVQDENTDSVIFNDSGGAVTLNVSGGSGAVTYRNGASASTTVNNNVTVTFDQLKDNSEVRVYAAGTNTELEGIEDATAGTVDDRNFPASIAAATSVDYVIHNFQPGTVIYQTIRVNSFTWPSANTTIVVAQQVDRNAEN